MIKKVLIGLLVLLVVLVLGKNLFITLGAETFVKIRSGMDLDLGRFKLGLLSSKVNIKNLELYNSSRFENERMVSIPEINIDLSIPKLLANHIYIQDFTLNLEELVVVKNKEGIINFKELNAFKGKGNKTKEKKAEKAGQKKDFYIESFKLSIGNVVFKDYSAGDEPKIQVFRIGVNREYKNIGSPILLANLIMVEALTRTSIAKLADLDLGDVKTMTQDTVNKGMDISKEAFAKGMEVTQDAMEKGKNAARQIEDKTMKSIEKLKSEAQKLVPTMAE